MYINYKFNEKILFASWLIQKKSLNFFKMMLGTYIKGVNVKNYDLELQVNSNNVYAVLYFLQKHTNCQFDCLIDMVCYDTPGKLLRFGVTYNLLSVQYNNRLRVSTKFNNTAALLSISSLYFGAS